MTTTPKPAQKRKTASERHPLAVAFGLYLKGVRTARDMSQSELAFDAGMDRTYVSLLERGVSAPSLLVLDALSKSLAMTIGELMAGFEAHLPKQNRRKPDVKRRSNEASLADAATARPRGNRRSPLR